MLENHKGSAGVRTRRLSCWSVETIPGIIYRLISQLFLKQKITQKTLQLHYSRSTAIFGQFSRCFDPCSCLWTEIVLTPQQLTQTVMLCHHASSYWSVTSLMNDPFLTGFIAVCFLPGLQSSLWLADQPPAGMTQMALCCDANQCLRFWWCALIIISINSLLNKQKRPTLFNTFLHWLFLFCKIKTFNLSTSQLSSDKLLLWLCQKQDTAWHNLCRFAHDVRIEINLLFFFLRATVE